MKVVYCGFDFFHDCLEECLTQGHELLGAFSQKVDGLYNTNREIKSFCENNKVPFEERQITSDDIARAARAGCDLLISAAYAHKIPTRELISNGIKAINIHPSLLPEGRGPWPLPVMILKNLTQSGVTIHKLSESFDRGDILTQMPFNLTGSDNLETVSFKARRAALAALRDFLSNLEGSWLNAKSQEAGSYWAMPNENERTLDWRMPVEHITTVVRAFGKFESYANFDGQDWLVQDATGWREDHRFAPGTVVARTNREVLIACADGLVCLRQYSAEIKK